MTITTERARAQRSGHRDPVRHPRRGQGPERDREVPVPGENTWVTGTHSRSDDLRLLRRHAGDAAQARDGARRRPPGRPRRPDNGPTPVEYLLHAIAACLTAGIANIAAARGRRAHQGHLDRRGRHRPARDPRPVRRLGPQRLRADQGHLPHRGRRRRRDPARHRRAVPPSLRRLRRPHQPHARRHRRGHRLTADHTSAAGRPAAPAGRTTGTRKETHAHHRHRRHRRRPRRPGREPAAHRRGPRPRRPRPRPGRRALAHRALGLAAPAHAELDDPAARAGTTPGPTPTASSAPASSSAYLEAYAASFGAPVVGGTTVRERRRRDAGGRYRVVTDRGTWRPATSSSRPGRTGCRTSRRAWTATERRVSPRTTTATPPSSAAVACSSSAPRPPGCRSPTSSTAAGRE